MSNGTTTETPEADQVAKQWAQTRLAHEAMMLADAQAVLKQNREIVRAHQGKLMESELPAEASDVIHIGDQYVTQMTPDAPASTGTSTAAKVATAAALLAGGAGAAVTAQAVLDAFQDNSAAVVAPAETQWRLEVVPETTEAAK